MLTNQILVLCTAYLLGSIPSGLLISQIFNLKDPRKTGSKSTGATNILRSGHYIAAGLTLLMDVFKGSAAVILPLIFTPDMIHYCAILVVVGHIWPIWLGFKGGKGVATAFGALFILSFPLALMSLICWATIAVVFRYSSLASIVTVILSPIFTSILSGSTLVGTCIALAILILWAHRKNIGRLLRGSEPKIGQSSKESS